MLKFSKGSWHYKFMTENLLGAHNVPDSLCPYVRSLVFRMVISFVVALFLGLMILCMISTLTWIPYLWISSGVGPHGNSGASVLLTLGTILNAFFSIGLWVEVLQPKLEKKLGKWNIKVPTTANKEPSVFWEWVKALHNKFCPVITFEDKEK